MTDSPDNTPHFYFDEKAQRWISVERSALAKVLVFSWHAPADSMAEQINAQVKALAAELFGVPKDRVVEHLGDLASGDTVACVLFLSPAALEDPSLHQLVAASVTLFQTRPEFRLFVQLADSLTFEKLKSAAQEGNEAAHALIDSVHFSKQGGDAFGDTARRLQNHLLDLPRIQHRLARERSESKGIALLSLAVGFLRWFLLVAAALLLLPGILPADDRWDGLRCFATGQLSYLGLLTLLTSLTRVAAGFFLRWAFSLGPLILIWMLPRADFWSQWPFVAVGILTAFVLDVGMRSLAQWKRRSVQIKDLLPGDASRVPCPGRRPLKYLATGPWFPGRSRVFVSYSERSNWGHDAAENLHTSLERLHIDCFFAPSSIEHGSSWRHRLASELCTASVFIQFLDDTTARLKPGVALDQHWPALELAGASTHQAIGALPSIIIVRHPNLRSDTMPTDTHPYIRRVIAGAGDAEDSSLWVLQDEEGMVAKLAQELSRRYRWQAVSILPIKAAAVLELLLMPPALLLGLLGVLGSVGIGLALIAGLVMWIRGAGLVDWLLQHGYAAPVLVLAAYWLGFILRLGAASRLEIWHRDSGASFKWRLLEAAALGGLSFWLGLTAEPLALACAGVAIPFGFLLGSHYLRRASEGKGWTLS